MSDEANIDQLLQMANLITPMTLRVAATLRLADHVAAGAVSVPDLARRTGCAERPLRKIMDHLVAIGVMRRTSEHALEGSEGSFALGVLGMPLLSEHDALGVRPLLDLDNLAGRVEMAMTHLLHTVRTGQAAYEGARGKNLWDDINESPARFGSLDAFEKNTAAFDAELVLNGFDWSTVRTVVDVGGNSGALMTAVLQAYPHLQGTLVDLPQFADMAARNFRAAALADRTTVVGGSFFDPLPAGQDVYLISAILADWDDKQSVEILRNCAQAAGPAGRVLLAEVHMEPVSTDPEQRSRIALWLEASMGNPDRTVAELTALGGAAGLEAAAEPQMTEVRSLIEFRVPR
ncbi:methyltransferase [Streptomyces platensis]|uniref:methyltransferase n=1 Tax=Streptomyces platensis TaxID=58346 RepID=UPI0036A2F256